MTGSLEFVLNGVARRLPPGTLPGQTLLEWLRGPEAGLTGTKEGCAEGDCGACTVVMEEPDGTRTPLNACLALLGQMHGRSFRTVEGLRGPDGAPHPVQHALAEGDATQCGFCTPGIVMSAWAYPRASEGAEGSVHEALAGNLCRCTGYRPILGAFASIAEASIADDGAAAPPSLPAAGYFAAPGQEFHLPAELPSLLALRAAMPQAWLLAGGTDLGLRVSEQREKPPAILCLSAVPELKRLEAGPEGLRIGAGVTYGRLLRALEAEPDLAPLALLLRRLGSRQIRGMGTLGGNLGTASPIGDALPPLLALGARIALASAARGERMVEAGAFFTGYRQTLLAPDEVIARIDLPRPLPGAIFVCEKLSRRHDQDISTLSAAFLLRIEDGHIAEARLAFGGMAATPARACRTEAALVGAPLEEASFATAAEALEQDFTPLSDWRGSAAYRLAGAAGLVRRLYWRAARPDLPLEVHAL
ncbi:xanthine dehydrogenase small subunit [Roseomonas marmotae]|uniref:FAD binding domain-containing protein n=1 Tax=Roseomonas marmotae TaxID=2768161 RepID=A0ABS3KEV6_9PROT|nr:FAD binding domain-containing protein [Roseomonas marmotae]MBO1076003.1 FAD binding domain-containing protein [Roseomonas marmotae]QTI80135.1 FAD binding domain-containing protein [Roseomonas marmotae]